MQSRRSVGDPSRLSIGSINGYGRSDRDGLIRSYDEEENLGFGLTDLAEESEDDAPLQVNGKAKANGKATPNGRSFSQTIEIPRTGSRSPMSPRSPMGARTTPGSRSPLRSPR